MRLGGVRLLRGRAIVGPMHPTDIVIQDREELFFLLCEAAEFEHSVMCSYLYAMWSLKREAAEGVTAEELAAIDAVAPLAAAGGAGGDAAPVAGQQHPGRHRRGAAPVAAGVPGGGRLVPVRRGDAALAVQPRRASTTSCTSSGPRGSTLVDGAGFDHPAHHPRACAAGPADPDAARLRQPGPALSRHPAGPGAPRGRRSARRMCSSATARRRWARRRSALPGLFKVDRLDAAAPGGRGDRRCRARARRRTGKARTTSASPPSGPSWRRCRPRGPASSRRGRRWRTPAWTSPLERPDVAPSADPSTAKVVDLGNALYALMMRTFAQVFSPAPLPRALRGRPGGGGDRADVRDELRRRGGHPAARRPTPSGGDGGADVRAAPVLRPAGAALRGADPRRAGARAGRRGGQAGGERAAGRRSAGRLSALADRFAGLHERFEEHLTPGRRRPGRRRPPPAPAAAPMAAAGRRPERRAARGDHAAFDASALHPLAPLRAGRAQRLPGQCEGPVAAPGDGVGRAVRRHRPRLPLRRHHLPAP